MLNPSIIKKTVYALAVVCVVTVIFLAFFRKTPNLTASQRNASFLEVKHNENKKTEENKATDSKPNESETKKEGDSTTNPGDAKKTEDQTNKSSKTEALTQGTDKPASIYTVKEGDTYGCIAEKYYGSYEHWVDVLNANIKYGKGFEERNLFVDAKLEMPAISKSNLKPSTKLCQ